MASACINNNNVGVPTPTKFSNSYSWLTPARLSSFTRHRQSNANATDDEKTDLMVDEEDFEFRLDQHVTMLPADELISQGKLVPMAIQQKPELVLKDITSGNGDSSLFSPRPPRCALRWKDIFGLKKLHQNREANKPRKNRNTKLSSRHSDCESNRLSLSSSRSGHEQLEILTRLSLDQVDKHNDVNPISLLKSVANSPTPTNTPPRLRLISKTRLQENTGMRMSSTGTEANNAATLVSVSAYADSPRMNPAGKIVFHSLERSSSSPSTFNGGPRLKYSGMERSYSANVVRVTPVLYVPVCSLSKSSNVLGLFTSQQKKDSISERNSRSYQIINNTTNTNSGNARSRTQW